MLAAFLPTTLQGVLDPEDLARRTPGHRRVPGLPLIEGHVQPRHAIARTRSEILHEVLDICTQWQEMAECRRGQVRQKMLLT